MKTKKQNRKIVTLDPNKLLEKPKRDIDLSKALLAPEVDEMFGDAMTVLSNEIEYYKDKTLRGNRLSNEESGIMTRYIKAMVDLSKEAREIVKSKKLDEMTDEQLLDLVDKFVKSKK